MRPNRSSQTRTPWKRWRRRGPPYQGVPPSFRRHRKRPLRRNRQEYDDQGHQRPMDKEELEGKFEDEVADVAAELGVLHSERHPVTEQDPVLPLAERLRSHDECQHDDEPDPQPPDIGPDHLL